MSDVAAAAALLAETRRTGGALPGLPEALRPATLEEAEAIQMATFAVLGEAIGGWKVGRAGVHVYSAPMPVRVQAGDEAAEVSLPAGAGIEMEIALLFRAPVPANDITMPALPELADLAILFEFCAPLRFPVTATPLERVADCAVNVGALVRPFPRGWMIEELEHPSAARLFQDGAEIAQRDRTHPAAPVLGLLEGWAHRMRRMNRTVGAGEVVSLGSLIGMPPIPAGGAEYLGGIAGLGSLRCRVSSPP